MPEQLPDPWTLIPRQHVGAVLGEARCRLGGGEAGRAGVQARIDTSDVERGALDEESRHSKGALPEGTREKPAR